MPVASTETADARAEKALAAYLRGHRDANSDTATFAGTIDLDSNRAGALSTIPIHEGRQTQNLVSPSVVVSCQRAQQMYTGVGWYQVTAEIILTTNRQEDDASTEYAEVVHNARSKAIEDLVIDEATMQLALNLPAVGTDARAVDEFTLHGSWLETNAGEIVEGKFVETWELMLICSPWDALNL